MTIQSPDETFTIKNKERKQCSDDVQRNFNKKKINKAISIGNPEASHNFFLWYKDEIKKMESKSQQIND